MCAVIGAQEQHCDEHGVGNYEFLIRQSQSDDLQAYESSDLISPFSSGPTIGGLKRSTISVQHNAAVQGIHRAH